MTAGPHDTRTTTAEALARLPWRRIAIALGIAAFGAWFVGFAVGLLVRFALGR